MENCCVSLKVLFVREKKMFESHSKLVKKDSLGWQYLRQTDQSVNCFQWKNIKRLC